MTVQALTHRSDLVDGVVRAPYFWESQAGWEFWFLVGQADIVTAESSTNAGLDGRGWILGSVGGGSATGGDFLSAADQGGINATLTINPSQLVSPRIFGSYDHMLQASEFLGYMPTKLNLEVVFRMTTISNNETTTFVGFAAPGVVDAAAAGCAGAIRSGGTASTFFLTSDNGSDAGAAITTNFQKYRITIDATNTEWFIDDVSQGTIATEADIFPVSFMIYATNNDVEFYWARVWYS